MSKLEERERRRRASVAGAIAGIRPEAPARKRGRPREDRETRKRVSVSVLPSLYGDIQKIAYVQRRSTSSLLSELLEQYREAHRADLTAYEAAGKKD